MGSLAGAPRGTGLPEKSKVLGYVAEGKAARKNAEESQYSSWNSALEQEPHAFDTREA